MVQLFKGDALEQKMYNVGKAPADSINAALDQFYQGIYSCVPLGEFIYDQDRAPLATAIKREVFINCYNELFDAFSVAGTFESYITVLKKIFGQDALVEFIAQGGSGLAEYAFEYDDDEFVVDHLGDILYFGEPFTPGNLIINVETSSVDQFIAEIREISGNEYIEYDLVDDVGDNIIFSSVVGIETESELEDVVFVLAPAGIYTQVNLTII